MKTNKIYCGDACDLIDDLDITPNLIIMSPPDLNETSLTLDEYKQFLYYIYTSCADKLNEGGALVSITTDTKIKGTIFTKHMSIINALSNKLTLFNSKIWAKSLKTNLYILNFCYMSFFCKGKRPTIKNKLSEFYPDVWLLERDKIEGYPDKDSFPSELVRRLVLTFTNEGDVVLDPFIGSGKTGKVAKDNNRNYIGFEIDKKNVEIAEKWISS